MELKINKTLKQTALVIVLAILSFSFQKTNNAQGDWVQLSYDDFESGWGNWGPGGADALITNSTQYSRSGENCADISDDNNFESSISSKSYDLSSEEYTSINLNFWIYSINMESGDVLYIDYFDGLFWNTVGTYYYSVDFQNGQFNNLSVNLLQSLYNFSRISKFRIRSGASYWNEHFYIDEISLNGELPVQKTNNISWTILSCDDFEAGWGNYTPEGVEATRINNGDIAHQGLYSAKLGVYLGIGNSIVSSSFDFISGGYDKIIFEFWYYANETLDNGDYLIIEYFNGTNWSTLKTLSYSSDYMINGMYHIAIELAQSNVTFSTNSKFRLKCDANTPGEFYTIDEIKISVLNPPPVENITISPKTVSLFSDETAQLSIDVTPELALDKTFSTTFSKDDIVTINANGLITPLQIGQTIATLTTNDGGFTDEVSISVNDYGDINADFLILPFDAAIALNQSVGNNTSTWGVDTWGTYEMKAGDVNLNTIIDATDAAYILQYSVGLISDLPVGSKKSGGEEKLVGIDFENDSIIFTANGEVLGFSVDASQYSQQLGAPVIGGNGLSSAQNISDSTYRVALAGTAPIQKGTRILSIPVTEGAGHFDLVLSINGVVVAKQVNAGIALTTQINEPTSSGFSIYPNPLSSSADISVTLMQPTNVCFDVYSITGKKVAALNFGQLPQGIQNLHWDAKSSNGSALSAGIYFYALSAGDKTFTGKLVVK